jgi:hypothetical protein
MEWDRLRNEYVASPLKLRKTLMDEMRSIAEGNAPKINGRAISQISKALQVFSSQISIPVIHSVFKMFDEWMLLADPELCIKFNEYHKLFLRERAKQESQLK